MLSHSLISSFFFFNDTATTEIYTLSLHDALPILTAYRIDFIHEDDARAVPFGLVKQVAHAACAHAHEHLHEFRTADARSEEHTSELQSHSDLVCRLLLEKKKINIF